MKLTVSIPNKAIRVLGHFDPEEIIPGYRRLVYIDDVRVPPALSKIILAGLDVMVNQYTDLIEKQMREEGHII